jgi:ThiF family
MSIPFALSLTEEQYMLIKKLLLPVDGNEKPVVIALCGERAGDRRHRIMVREIFATSFPGANDANLSQEHWNSNLSKPLLDPAKRSNVVVVMFKSSNEDMSSQMLEDKADDLKILSYLQSSTGATGPLSMVQVYPDGQLAGGVLAPDNSFIPLKVISVVGDDIQYWYSDNKNDVPNDFCASHSQLFGAGTTERLQRLSVAVIGCSGTGSPLIEQLARLGVGELVLIDHDPVEERNLNRIYNSSLKDVQQGRLKVDVLADAIRKADIGTRVIAVPYNLWSAQAVHAAAQCDVVFGCMDGADGRYLLNTLSTYYTIPYFDIGIRLEAEPDGFNKGRINEVCGAVHYLQPGRSSLMSRQVITMKKVGEDGLLRKDPSAHAQERRDGYISGVKEHRPAVISVNTLAASLAVNEFLARIHPYREEQNGQFAQIFFSLSSMEIIPDNDDPVCPLLQPNVGLGDTTPLLGQLELSIMGEK